MGQYYVPVLIASDGRILTLNAHNFGNGLKLTEHSWIGNNFVNAAYSLLLGSPKKVAWIGDYACDDYDPDNEAYAKVMPLEDFQRFYDAAHGEDCKALSAGLFTGRDMGVLDYDTKKMFLVNHDKRVYIDMEAFIRENTARGGDWDGWCMNPLPLLTACGNNRGGGDFRQNGVGYEDIGIWAFDTLEYTSIVPKGFNEAIFFFNDHRRTTAV